MSALRPRFNEFQGIQPYTSAAAHIARLAQPRNGQRVVVVVVRRTLAIFLAAVCAIAGAAASAAARPTSVKQPTATGSGGAVASDTLPSTRAGLAVLNLPAGRKRPRSSMSPTIVLGGGRPFLAVGAAGGATIITTVLQILMDRIDLHMTLPEAIAAPRASQRNSSTTQAEPAFIAEPTTAGLEQLGQTFSISDTSPLDPAIKIAPTIGTGAGLEVLGHDRYLAATEPTRRGGGSAGVLRTGH